MVEILYAPGREQVVSTNVWAFLHWLRTTRGIDLAGWTALQRWSVSDPALFEAAVRAFAAPSWSGDSRRLAELLLFADIRPDDRLLVIGPWIAGVAATAVPADLLAAAAEQRASVLVAPAPVLAEAAFRHARQRPDLRGLRTIIGTGGPLSPEGRRRIYTWVKPDVMLLARTGDTFWGNPVEPVLVRPAATPAFLTPPASAPVPR